MIKKIFLIDLMIAVSVIFLITLFTFEAIVETRYNILLTKPKEINCIDYEYSKVGDLPVKCLKFFNSYYYEY